MSVRYPASELAGYCQWSLRDQRSLALVLPPESGNVPSLPGFLQLGAGDTDYKVVSALLPEKLESLMGEEQEEVTFYPFVVVLETSEGKQFCWTPNLRTCWGTQSHATQ